MEWSVSLALVMENFPVSEKSVGEQDSREFEDQRRDGSHDVPHYFAEENQETHCGSECFCGWEGVRQTLVLLPCFSHWAELGILLLP